MLPSPSAAPATTPARDPAKPEPEFPGCRAVRITRDAIADFDGRIEYWNGDTETAWMVREPTTVYHEGPGQRLARLVELIAAGRGSPITTLGTADLLVRNPRGERQRILQADQIVYLAPPRPSRAVPPSRSARTTCPTSCSRSTTRRTCGAGSWACTKRGASPRCGSRCRRPTLRPDRRAVGPA